MLPDQPEFFVFPRRAHVIDRFGCTSHCSATRGFRCIFGCRHGCLYDCAIRA